MQVMPLQMLLLAAGAMLAGGTLAEELLMGIGSGKLSVHRAAVLAAAQVTSGAAGVDLRMLARMQGNNGERALHRWAKRQLWRGLMPEPFKFKVKKMGKGEQHGMPTEAFHWALLPHEVFSNLAETAPDLWEFLFTGGRANLQAWWEAAAGAAGDWFVNHPVIQATPWFQRVPLGIHGDDAGMAGGEKVLVLSWGSVARDLGTLDSRLVFCMIRDSECVRTDTLQTVYQVLSWSFQALAAGVWPATDHTGQPFSAQDDAHRAAAAGRPLHPSGVRGAWAELRGDWKFIRECLHLARHYGCNEVCHLCMAHKRTRMYLYTDLGRQAYHRTTRVTHTVWMAAALAAALVSPLLMIPGFNIWRVYFDVMHMLEPHPTPALRAQPMHAFRDCCWLLWLLSWWAAGCYYCCCTAT